MSNVYSWSFFFFFCNLYGCLVQLLRALCSSILNYRWLRLVYLSCMLAVQINVHQSIFTWRMGIHFVMWWMLARTHHWRLWMKPFGFPSVVHLCRNQLSVLTAEVLFAQLHIIDIFFFMIYFQTWNAGLYIWWFTGSFAEADAGKSMVVCSQCIRLKDSQAILSVTIDPDKGYTKLCLCFLKSLVTKFSRIYMLYLVM